MLWIGVDLHKTQFTVCMEGAGIHVEKVYETSEEGYRAFFEDVTATRVEKKSTHLGVEATIGVWYFANKVAEHVGEVKVIHPAQMKEWRKGEIAKTDKKDARVIAHEAEHNRRLKLVRLPDAHSRKVVKYSKVRDRYVKTMTKLKNQLHGLYTEEGIRISRKLLTSLKGMKKLEEIDVDEDIKMLALGMVRQLINLKTEVVAIDRKVAEMTKGDEVVEELMQMTGTGRILASIVRGVIFDIDRFPKDTSLGAYAGLVPFVNASNGVSTYGNISKLGSPLLRNALVQMATCMMRRPDLQTKREARLCAWANKITRRNGKKGKSIGKIALARKISEVIWYNLKALKAEQQRRDQATPAPAA